MHTRSKCNPKHSSCQNPLFEGKSDEHIWVVQVGAGRPSVLCCRQKESQGRQLEPQDTQQLALGKGANGEEPWAAAQHREAALTDA